MEVIARINGVDATGVSLLDRGLHYGDGVFETLAVRTGRVPLWSYHRERLLRDTARLGIAGLDIDSLQREVFELAHDCAQAVIKVIVTRGEGGRGYRPAPAAARRAPTRIVLRYPWPDYPASYREAGVVVRVCDTRLSINPALAGIKHLNRLEQVMARSEWYDPEIAEGLMCDQAGHVVEATQANVFLVYKGELLTPDVTEAGVAGVMRGLLIERAQAWTGVQVRETVLRLEDIQYADEVFLCNAVIGIWPVRRVEACSFAVGPVTKQLLMALKAAQDAWTNTATADAHEVK